MTNDILCLVDFSQNSGRTLKWAAEFASDQACNLTVLFTYRITRRSDDLIAWKKRVEEETIRKFLILEEECLKGTGINYAFRIEVGFANDRIEAFTKKSPARYLIADKAIYADRDAFDHLIGGLNAPLVIVP